MRIRRRHYKVFVAMLAALGLATLLAFVAFAVWLVESIPAAPPSVAASWRPPVGGAVTRSFDPGRPFEAGRHRGVDLAARPGTSVRAPCSGTVAFAGAVGSSGRVVTLRCGPWRVTHMPLAAIAVRPGATVHEGALLGTVAESQDHPGLHLGVRREGARFGYADPLRFLATDPSPPPLGRAPRPAPSPRPGPPRPPTRPAEPARRVVTPHPAAPRRIDAPRRAAAPHPLAAPHPTGSNTEGDRPLAPWPVWVGLALVLAGVGVRWRGGGRMGAGWAPTLRGQPVR